MTISLIVAAAKNNAIGKNGGLPWHLPEDMKYFKNITWAMPVIMGRKTFESLKKPLTGRKNIVITRQPDQIAIGGIAEGAVIVKNLDDALFVAGETDAKEVFIIGGGEIYALAFNKANRIYLTRVDAEPEADAFFPPVDSKNWQLVSRKDYEADPKNIYPYSFQVWERI